MSRDRGQTTLDFAIGIGVFLLVVAFTLAFIPGLVDPFTGGLEEETVAVNRVADSLSQGTLGDPSKPYVLDRECTIIFFESRSSSSEDSGGDDDRNRDGDGSFSSPFGPDAAGGYGGTCNFEDKPLTQRLGLEGRNGPALNVRVSLVRDIEGTEIDSADDQVAEPLCLDTNDNRIIEGDDPDNGGNQCDFTSGDDDVYFRIGDTPPDDTSSVVVARRVVSIEGGLVDGTTEATLVVEMW